MDAAGLIADEKRLAAVRETGLLDATSTAADRLTRLAQTLLGVPATFLSIVDEKRDFYLSQVGFGEPLASTRELTGKTFCHLAIVNEEPLAIGDTHVDPEHRAVPTVETLGVRAYLGVPIRLPGEHVLGSLCAIDTVPHAWSELERETLVELALSAEREFALEAAARREAERAARAERTLAELERSHWHIRRLQELLPLCLECNQVHEPDGSWQPLVEFLARDGLLVSHGYCPECAPAVFAAAGLAPEPGAQA